MFVFSEHRRWLIVALLFCLSMVNYIDRQTLSVLSKTLREQFGFSEIEYSYIIAAFLAAYTIGFLISGRIIDRVGVRVGIAFALAFWSISGMLHAAASGWVGLAVCRFLLGLGESFNAPGGAKAIGEWAPQRERGLSMAIFSNGFVMGAIVAPPLVTVIALHYGWQWAFIITGLIGFVLLVTWLWFYDNPENQKFISKKERDYILKSRGQTETEEKVPFYQIITHPYCYSLIIVRLLTDPLPYFFTFWLPEYLQTSREFTLAMIGLLGWLPFLASDIGGPGGGAISDFLVRRGFEPERARLGLMLAAACLMPLATIAVRTENAWISLGLIALLLGSQSCWTANLLTFSSELFPRSQIATVVGLAGMGGSIGGIISTLLTGRIISAYGYDPVFTVLAFLHLTAFGFLIFSIRRHRVKVSLLNNSVDKEQRI